MTRTLSILLCVAMMLTLASAAFAAGLGLSTAPKSTPTSATLWFDNADKRTIVEENVHHIWAGNGITFDTKLTNPANANTKIPTSVWPAQLTKGSTMTLKYPGMTAFEIICSTKTFAGMYKNSITDSNVTITVTDNTILVVLPAAVDSYTFDLTAGNGYAYGVTVYAGAETTRTADQDAAEFAIYAISKIGTVTLESRDAITAARAFYSTLTDAQKAMVTNYSVLTAAEAEWKALGGQPAETAMVENAVARTQLDPRTFTAIFAQNDVAVILKTATSGSIPSYTSLAADANVTIVYPGMTSIEFECNIPARPLPVSYAERLSSSIGSMEGVTVTVEDNYVTVTFDAPRDFITITMTGSCKVDLITIHAEPEQPEQPEQPNKDQEAADAVAAQIEALGTVTLQSESAIKAARGAYDALTDAQKALVTNYETLTAAEGRLQELKKEAETPVVPAGDNAIMFFALAALSMTAMVVLVAKKREF